MPTLNERLQQIREDLHKARQLQDIRDMRLEMLRQASRLGEIIHFLEEKR